ncbi:hypothetical protein Lal_00044691 [Lupinus albus]|nr:hypothetical protein Lal_00044691 [Lupinus albus]
MTMKQGQLINITLKIVMVIMLMQDNIMEQITVKEEHLFFIPIYMFQVINFHQHHSMSHQNRVQVQETPSNQDITVLETSGITED